MIPKDCKRLAEVDFPIALVSGHAARDKYVRSTPNTAIHPWWAQRPLAACRAMLLALLMPDPCDQLCSTTFKDQARNLLRQVGGCNPGSTDLDLRKALLKFIGDFANWDLAANRTFLATSRALIKAAHCPASGDGEYELPLIVDPFAGAGSIPLEALRIGCEAFATDLNPVACLILKVMLQDIPRLGPKLAEELRRTAADIRRQLETNLADLYPKDPDGATPIAYLWARTVSCESPNCGAEIALVSSFWLCKKAKRARAIRHRVIRADGKVPSISFEIFEPKSNGEVPDGTVTRAKATCVCCGAVLPPVRVRAQLVAQRGGADAVLDAKGLRIGGARLLAVVTVTEGEKGRRYRLPTDWDYEAVGKAQTRATKMLNEWERAGKQGQCPFPDEPLPLMSGTFNVPIYGITRWRDLYTARQLTTISALVSVVRDIAHSDIEIQKSMQELLVCVIDKFARHCNGNARWNNVIESVEPAFGMQALPITWTFPESIPWGHWAENFDGSVEAIAKCIEKGFHGVDSLAQVQIADAARSPLVDDSCQVWFTDPPYYFAVPYADLSDFFFVWIKRALPNHPLARDPFDAANPLTPKVGELCEMAHWDSVRYPHKDQKFFENGMAVAFSEGRRVLREDGIGCVVFAHKTTEGWEALLSGMIGSGWTVTGSWPIATERAGRLRARESAALNTSVHLICRPRSDDAGVGDWADVLRELPVRVGNWMERLQSEGVRGADLVFACIGPALEIFSRYTKVETAEGREVGLAEYLAKVWEVVGRSALAQVLGTAEAKARNGAAGAVEEDARLTALFLWTLQATDGEVAADASDDDGEVEEVSDNDEGDEGSARGKAKGFTLVFDVVRRFAQPLGIDLPKWQGRVIDTKKGVVRLLPIAERAKQLFGEDGAHAVASRLEQSIPLGTNPLQGMLFPEINGAPKVRGRGAHGRDTRLGLSVSDDSLAAAREATTLDRVHAAMLLQAGGRTNALRALLRAEQERGPDFLRLANALSALYPKGSEEKRLVDAMLMAVPR